MATAASKPVGSFASPHALALRELLANRPRKLAGFDIGQLAVEVVAGADSVFAIVRRAGQGGLASRLAYVPGSCEVETLKAVGGELARLRVRSALGEHLISLSALAAALDHLRATVRFTPSRDLLLPFVPRDLYPLDANDDPLGARGVIEAAQRGLNSGMLYFRIAEPEFGTVLYFQNLTAMNDYYRATGTKPDGVVGGEWPEIGHLLPTPEPGGEQAARPLPAGKALTISDAILTFRPGAPADERQSARHFLQMLGHAFNLLDAPQTDYRDWLGRGERTLRDLAAAPEATIRHYGFRYARPYLAGEVPDSMVQMALVSAIHDWGRWHGEPHPLEAELKAGLAKFYDPKHKALLRYLPNAPADRDRQAIDSWYLYHPLLNLGHLALHGDAWARRWFLKAVDYGIEAAHRFEYKWPIEFKVADFSVTKDVAGADGRGETDVGGVYAWVMLQAFELTDDKRFLDEARAAIDAAIGLRFDINYQANLTAWGAAACMRLWRITNRDVYRDQSYVYLGSFFHNCEIWESEIELARHYRNFLGATCLQDAPYMAIFECYDSFAAFEHYLDDGGPELEPAARMLIAEYCKYALDRAWYYYPDALPPEAIAPEQREPNGHVDRKLSFPLEDLYADGQQAGQVGQEVYGAGAALVFATRSHHTVEGATFRIVCDHFVRAWERTGERVLTITLDGGETRAAGLSLVRSKRRKLPACRLATAGGRDIRPVRRSADRIDFSVPASGRLVLSWD